MSNCTNCFNGCTEIISDRCVRYTGIDVPALGITTGDTLSHVESSIVSFLVPVLTGVGVKPIIDNAIICNVVKKYLPTCTTCTGFTLNEVLTAIIKAACDLQEQVDIINATLTTLNADYTIGCLTGVTASSDTHAIVQAIITKLCQLEVNLTALTLDLHTNYVSIANINSYIAAYINGTSSLISAKMIPYVAVPYFNPNLSNFDLSGAGIGTWAKIYLCNGANPGVPDLRGRVLVGATTGMGGGAFNPAVDPGIAGNPAYALGGLQGANQITLGPTQIPSHTHANTVNTVLTDPGHTHSLNKTNDYTAGGTEATSGFGIDTTQLTNSSGVNGTGITAVTTITNASFGGGLPHPNFQPGYGCYYIIYIP